MSSNGYEALADPAANLSRRLAVGDFGPRELVAFSKQASPQTRNQSAGGYRIGEELGRSGLRHWGGFVFEEWLRELQQGRRAAEVYRDMMDSDAIIGSIMYLIQTLIRRVTWRVEPGDGSAAAKKGADWYESVIHDMRHSWTDTVGDVINFLGYGYQWHEEVYKYRRGENRNPVRNSKFDDGTIGIGKLPVRSQDSLWKWIFDEEGEVEGLIQNPPPDYLLRFIPREKSLHFRTNIFKDNPEGRALAVDTEIPTPSGWCAIGDLDVGDTVYDEQGQPTPVVGTATWEDRPCYRVRFSAGHEIVADANHLWSVTTMNDRSKSRPQRLLTTEQMYECEAAAPQKYSAGLAPLLAGTSVYIPVDPYILGYWLGDGTRGYGRIACGEEDSAHLEETLRANGFRFTRNQRTYFVTGLVAQLRAAGVLHRKHVPADYLRAPADVRLAVLQGLMDSDGSADAIHSPRFGNGDELLLEGVRELVRSLGGVPRTAITARTGAQGGQIGGYTITATKDHSTVGFNLDLPVFRLPRKLNQQPFRRNVRSAGHNIESIERVENQRTVCIQVGKPLGLFLAGRGMVPTHNSVLRSAYGAFYFARNMRAIEGIGVERDLAGLPVLTPPQEIDLWNPNDPTTAPMQAMAQNTVSSIRRDEQEGVILPFGWELTLLTTGGRRQFDVGAIITRYETRMAMTILADIVMMGQDKVGSYALAVTKKDTLAMSLGGHLDIVASQFNTEQIPRLWKLNGFTWPQPKLVHGAVESIDLDTLGNFLMRMAQAQAPIDWSKTLDWAMEIAGAPEASPGHDYSPRPAAQETASDRGPSRGPVANSSPIAKALSDERRAQMEDFDRWRDLAWEGA